MSGLSQKVKELRLARGLSQEALAREMKVSRETVRSIEKGRHTPRLETIASLARALKVSVAQLELSYLDLLTPKIEAQHQRMEEELEKLIREETAPKARASGGPNGQEAKPSDSQKRDDGGEDPFDYRSII